MKENYDIYDNYEANKLKKKAFNKVNLPQLGKMEFLSSDNSEVVGTQVKVASVDIGEGCLEYLKGNSKKREELFESHKAFWACGSEIDGKVGVNQFIGLVSHKNQDIPQPTVGMDYVRSKFRVGGNLFSCQSWVLCGSKRYQTMFHSFLQNASFVLVDGYCDTEIKNKIVELINNGKINAENLVLVRRYDSDGYLIDQEGTTLLEGKLREKGCQGNVIDGNNYEALAAKGKEMYTKVLIKSKNEIVERMEKEKKKNKKKRKKNDISKIERLFNTVKENKGKAAGGLVVFTTLEELLRRSFFGGEKTNEKEKDSKYLKKLVDQKDTDEYPNRKDKNSAAT